MSERPIHVEDRRDAVADFLEKVAISPDPADRMMLDIFLDNVDMGRAMIHSLSGETVLSAPIIKNCDSEVWLCLRDKIRDTDADVSIAVEHKPIMAGDRALHFEVFVHGTIRSGHPSGGRLPGAHLMDTVFFTRPWTRDAFIVTGQIGDKIRERLQATNPS